VSYHFGSCCFEEAGLEAGPIIASSDPLQRQSACKVVRLTRGTIDQVLLAVLVGPPKVFGTDFANAIQLQAIVLSLHIAWQACGGLDDRQRMQSSIVRFTC
jgi:hypothetical protein